MKYDFIVIGAGINGLQIAALLSHDGYKVLVFEKNAHIGGRAFIWEKDGFIGSYLHHNRKLAVLVELSLPDDEAGREVAMQVAAANPEYLDDTSVPADVQEKEKAIFLRQVQDKPENIREKIVDGKWRKRLTELCLLDQPFLKEPSLSVRKYLRQRGEGLTVKSYIRWRLGEE